VTANPLPEPLHAALVRAVGSRAGDLAELSDDLRTHPELGYQESYAAGRVADWVRGLGAEPRTGVAGTGVVASLPGARPGPTVALLGELDAVHVPSHPDADPRTGAAHACGHHASLAAVCGAAAALADVRERLAGRVLLVATPAEEMLPPSALDEVRADGSIAHATGKAELIARGEFDDVDLALMVHTGREDGPAFSVGDTLNGAVQVRADFEGTSAHSGSSPWLGVDAGRAARLAVQALEAQRDTFPDEDEVRMAVSLSQPEAAPGAVAAHCRLNVLVRARTLDALERALPRIDRALHAGAVAVGAGLTRTTELMYVPHRSAAPLDDVVADQAARVVTGSTARGRQLGACSDIGDLALLMPVSHPYVSGAVGHHHSPSFRVHDDRRATLEPATFLAATVAALLHDDAALARHVLAQAPPQMTRSEYARLRSRWLSARDAWPRLEGGLT
jgi:amidohydrolase